MSDSSNSSTSTSLVTFRARKIGPKAPFGNETVEFSLKKGGCLCLEGASGLGKTTLAMVVTGLTSSNSKMLRNQLNIAIEACDWDPSIPSREQCGVLFQQTTLLDELTVAGNLQLALDHCPSTHSESSYSATTKTTKDGRIKQLLDMVGLDYDRDAGKRPNELSGGMGRRASLALQLAQRKRVVVLDEPFTGLDQAAAISVAKELVHLRKVQGTAFLLISHEPHLSKIVRAEDDPQLKGLSQCLALVAPTTSSDHSSASKIPSKPSLFGTSFLDRFVERLLDYTFFSLPLIGLAFTACGLAIAMLTADLMKRLDINDQVLELVDREVRPLIKLLTGEDATTFQMMGVRFKVSGMLNQTVPPAKAALFAIGLTKLFVLEVGPLLTALLLCGRIGGAYAGKVGTLQATAQNRLLQTLGVSPRWWTLAPSLLAASIAGPLLTVVGTGIALGLGGWVGPSFYAIGTHDQFLTDLRESLFPLLRIKSFAPLWQDTDGTKASWALIDEFSNLDLSVTYRVDSGARSQWMETLIELLTYPPFYHLVKAQVFSWIILGVAEIVARWQPNLTPRGVPSVITGSVVLSGLLVILADWGFSQLWLLRN